MSNAKNNNMPGEVQYDARDFVIKESAVDALQKFRAGNYWECFFKLSGLRTLKNTKEYRWNQFNKAVAEFYLSNLENTDAFRKELVQITGQLWPSVNANEIKSPADAAIFYSYSVLLYHSRYYAQADIILEKLFSFRDQIVDPNLANGIALLLMEVCLCRRLPDKLAHYAEQAAGALQTAPPEYGDLFKKLKLRASLMSRKQLLPPADTQSVEWLFLRAHQQFVNGDVRGAAATLGRQRLCAPSPPGADEPWAPLNNNLGVLYSAMGKHNIAVKYMQQALKEHLRTLEGDRASRLTAPKDRPLYVFNLGVALLKANRPEDAFECLVEAARHFPNNPRIWLRIAECCVNHYNKTERRDPVVSKIGSGPHLKLVPGRIDKDRGAVSGESYAIPTLSLEFSALCLMNSVTLLPAIDPPAEADRFTFHAAPSSPMNFKQYADLRNSVLLLNSFVCLRLGDPTMALQHCTAALARPGPPAQRALAHLYAAEALISLDRITEAIDHLNPTVIHDIANKISSGSQDAVGVAVWLNGAVCHAVRGDLITARNILLQINSPRALPLQLYLEMCAGNLDNCRLLLRKFTQLSLQ